MTTKLFIGLKFERKKDKTFLVFDNEFGNLDIFGSEKPATMNDMRRAIMPPMSSRRKKGKR